jgi:hypothetical protein
LRGATTYLNIAMLVGVALPLVRFFRIGGVGMIHKMDMRPEQIVIHPA